MARSQPAKNIVGVLTAEGCPACEKVSLQDGFRCDAIARVAAGIDADRIIEVRFTDKSARRILRIAEIHRLGGAGLDLDPPHAAAFWPYAIAFPLIIVFSEDEWRRVCTQKPGFAHPGAPDIYARAPGWRTVAVEPGECGTQFYALRRTGDDAPDTKAIVNLVARDENVTRFVSPAHRRREVAPPAPTTGGHPTGPDDGRVTPGAPENVKASKPIE